jgi:hypothetical protein
MATRVDICDPDACDVARCLDSRSAIRFLILN